MKTPLSIFKLVMLTAVLSLGLVLSASTQTVLQNHKPWYVSTFKSSEETNPEKAYWTAKTFLRKWPNDTGATAVYIRKWVATYEKNRNNNQPVRKTSTPTPSVNNTAPVAISRDDKLKIDEARLARSKVDVKSAKEVMQEVSSQGKQSPEWLLEMYQICREERDYTKAFSYYSMYAEKMPQSDEIDKFLVEAKLAAKQYEKRKDLTGTWEKAYGEKFTYIAKQQGRIITFFRGPRSKLDNLKERTIYMSFDLDTHKGHVYDRLLGKDEDFLVNNCSDNSFGYLTFHTTSGETKKVYEAKIYSVIIEESGERLSIQYRFYPFSKDHYYANGGSDYCRAGLYPSYEDGDYVGRVYLRKL